MDPVRDAVAAVTAALGERYAIDRELGRGGMATVYVAQDRRHGREVAVKVLRPDVAAAIGAERFLREITIAARLTHPHVLPLLDSGQAAGSLYYVMPYVRGETLRQRLVREQRLPLKDALAIARELGGALDYAHRRRAGARPRARQGPGGPVRECGGVHDGARGNAARGRCVGRRQDALHRRAAIRERQRRSRE